MKKIILPLTFLFSFSLISCSNTENENPIVPPKEETKTDYILYFFGEDTNDLIRSRDELDSKYLDPNKETLIFFHGRSPEWDPNLIDISFDYTTTDTGTNKGLKEIDFAKKYKELGYNVGVMYWEKYTQNLTYLFRDVWVSFLKEESIAYHFAMDYLEAFSNYTENIYFVGHSFGAQTSLATTYLLYNMNDKESLNLNLPKRVTLADPYIGDYALSGDMEDTIHKNIYYIDEPINGRNAADLSTEVMEYLANKGVLIDAYCGWQLAYDDIYNNKADIEKRKDVYEKICNNAIYIVLEGFESHSTYSI